MESEDLPYFEFEAHLNNLYKILKEEADAARNIKK